MRILLCPETCAEDNETDVTQVLSTIIWRSFVSDFMSFLRHARLLTITYIPVWGYYAPVDLKSTIFIVSLHLDFFCYPDSDMN